MSKKNVSPMKRMNFLFEQFSLILMKTKTRPKECTFQCHEKPNEYSKNVDKVTYADFLRVYEFENKESISFKFTFLNEDKKTVSEEQYLEIIFKERFNERYFKLSNSKAYNIEDAKELMKSINFLLKMKGNINQKILFKILTDFLKVEDTVEEKDNLNEIFELENKDLYDDLEKENLKLSAVELELAKSNRELSDYYSNLEELKIIRSNNIKINQLYSENRKLNQELELKNNNYKEYLKIKESEIEKRNIVLKINLIKQKIINISRAFSAKIGMDLSTTEKIVKKKINEIDKI